jgi:hypothetical protein
MITSLALDLNYVTRRLFRSPLFTACAVAVLAIGIGLNAVVFNLVDTVLFRPLPFGDVDRIVHIYQDSDNGVPTSTSFPAYRDMAETTDVFSAVAATSPDSALWDADGGERRVSIRYTTASYLSALGLEPHLGRWFGGEHDRVGAERVAVVSYDTWRARLGADPGVLGRRVSLNNQAVTIVGVGPESFSGEANALVTDFWLSISSVGVGGAFRVANLDQRESHWYQVVARLAPGVSIERARVAMDALAARHAETYPAVDEGRGITVFAHDEVRIHPLADGALRGGSVALLGIAALVLLLACGNLANPTGTGRGRRGKTGHLPHTFHRQVRTSLIPASEVAPGLAICNAASLLLEVLLYGITRHARVHRDATTDEGGAQQDAHEGDAPKDQPRLPAPAPSPTWSGAWAGWR